MRDMWKRGAYGWSVVSADSSFLVCSTTTLRPEEDITGSSFELAAGWYVKDGVRGSLVSGQREIVECGADGRPVLEVWDAVDEHGRDLHAEGQAVTWFKWLGYDVFSWWLLTEWTFDGQTAWGELTDYYSFRQNYRFQKALREEKAKAMLPG
jgi:hypothetical protein